jgi:hypothetical protein
VTASPEGASAGDDEDPDEGQKRKCANRNSQTRLEKKQRHDPSYGTPSRKASEKRTGTIASKVNSAVGAMEDRFEPLRPAKRRFGCVGAAEGNCAKNSRIAAPVANLCPAAPRALPDVIALKKGRCHAQSG